MGKLVQEGLIGDVIKWKRSRIQMCEESKNRQSFKAEKKPELPTVSDVVPGFAGERPPSAGRLVESQPMGEGGCGHLTLTRGSERG